VVCSIDVTARDGILADGFTVAEPNIICAQYCIGQAFQWYYDTHPDRVELATIHFDQNERFITRSASVGNRRTKGIIWSSRTPSGG
jgi:hypothetical protein